MTTPWAEPRPQPALTAASPTHQALSTVPNTPGIEQPSKLVVQKDNHWVKNGIFPTAKQPRKKRLYPAQNLLEPVMNARQ